MAAPEIIHKLVENFNENRDGYRSGKYNEAQLRLEFLNPFFESLGWDVYNKNGWAPENRDVVIEDSMDIEGSSKKPDYTFKLGRERKFFVEAKKPKVDIQYDIHPAYQLRRYAWNAHMPLSVLTDFEELAIYNCKPKPDPKDSAATAREKFYKYTDYIEKWDEIAAILSKDAVWKGAFDRFADASKGKKGTTAVDDEFLKDMSNWRVLLARNIALRNPIGDEEQLNYAVQMTIDRIIFLRICEDRGIEPEEQLKGLAEKPGIYTNLVELFKRADIKYNSGLFHFKLEKGNGTPEDRFTPGLNIDDKVLKEIIKDIYYPCPYIFKEIPVEILGQVYEQFLGKVIRLTAGHRAEVEEKPEVRKAGGVYYTPKYIVDYIVQNTVGKLLEGKTPAEAARLKIVDPACGSGSFLLGAYQHLLDWHLKWYSENEPERWVKGKNAALTQTTVAFTGGFAGYRLTTEKKKEILVNNIHGVDIDAQAVEVTKLSLLLKVLEEESGQLTLGFERVLPDLGKNIQCGNSLIGEDYFAGRLVSDPAERKRVNPFDWQRAFPEVFAQGGFDAVIGNPPYIRIQVMREWAPGEVEFYKGKYKSASTGNYDIYVLFIEKGMSLLASSGTLGFILPHKFFTSQYGVNIRGQITKGMNLSKIVHFGENQIFNGATTYTCLLFIQKKPALYVEYEYIKNLSDWINNISYEKEKIDAKKFTAGEWRQVTSKKSDVFEKISQLDRRLGDITKIFVGTQTSADDIFVLTDCSESNGMIEGYSKSLNSKVLVEKELTKPFLFGRQIRRFHKPQSTTVLLCPYIISQTSSELMGIDQLRQYPAVYEYFSRNKTSLMAREKGRFKHQNWYAFGYPKSMTLFQEQKIIVPDYNNEASFTIDNLGFFYKTGYGVILQENSVSYLYLLGLLNSKLLFNYLQYIGTSLRGGYIRFWTQFIKQLPIVVGKEQKQELMTSLVDRMLELHNQTSATPREEEQLRREIESTDRQIDALVYELYGLTDEEIRIVEGGEESMFVVN